MKKISYIICFFSFLFVGCNQKVENVEVVADLENTIPLDSVNNYLAIDSLMPISSTGSSIANVDKVVVGDSYVFILDKVQQVVFRIDVSTKTMEKIIDYCGHSQNEYISITDIATDKSSMLYVFDSESQKVNLYDFDGKYQRSVKVVAGSSISVSDTNEIAINTNQMEDDILVVFSSSGELRYRIPYSNKASQHILEDMGSVVSYNDGFIYTTPFDYSIYQSLQSTNNVLSMINLGDNQFDTNKLKGLTYPEFQQLLLKESNKVMLFDHLNVYNHLLFFSTDGNDQLIYDMNRNKVITISNLEPPYNILFSYPLSVGRNGLFCVVLDNSMICDTYFSWLENESTKLPQLQPKDDFKEMDDDTIWLLMGTVLNN